MTSTSESFLNIKDIVESEFLISVNYSFEGTFSGLRQFLATESPLKMKNDEKCFLFPLKISFFFYVYVLTFWSFIKTAWLKRLGYFQIL